MTSEKTTWGYARLSQRGRDGNLDDQLETVRDYTRAQEDMDLVTTLNEGDLTSGFDSDRPKYQQLLSKIENAEIDAVVVRDRARLSRDFDERLQLIVLFRTTGVELHVVEAGGYINLTDVQTAGMECIHAAMDHFKKMAEIERSREVTENRLDEGYDHGRPPYGLTFDEDGHYWVPGEDYFRALRAIAAREQDWSYRRIESEVEIPRSTARRIVERRETYENLVLRVVEGDTPRVNPR
jgi:DNA invertase Pin-like site-specific DNA recombinase